MQQHVDSKYTFLILLNIFLLLLGAVLDIFSALVIMVPLILPLAVGTASIRCIWALSFWPICRSAT